MDLSQETLENLVSLELPTIKAALEKVGGIDELLKNFGTDPDNGLTSDKVTALRAKFGVNEFPEAPLKAYWEFLVASMNDTTLLVLLAAATVSLIVGIIEEGAESGWIEGVAIYAAVILVSNITAINDHAKQFQFAELEKTANEDDKCTVVRNGEVVVVNPREVVVGDLLTLNQGDAAPADCIIVSKGMVYSNQSSLTGESDDLKKSRDNHPVIYSSCTVPKASSTCFAIAIGTGLNSQWGKIKASTAVEHADTPLQEKLNVMTELIGYIGMGAAALTFFSLVINIWARDNGEHVAEGFIHAFILAVTIVVVAIPEGLPLAVTIALAYSTSEMYKDQCFIRHLSACETMGNATNICSDKTGTLTENRMTVVTGWYSGQFYPEEEFEQAGGKLKGSAKQAITDQASINRTAYLVYNDTDGTPLPGPKIIGNKTEGALIIMAQQWGVAYAEVEKEKFREGRDKVFAFNSAKKRSSCVIHQPDGTVRVFCKGASEWVMKDVTKYLDVDGQVKPLDAAKRAELEQMILNMANRALRTLTLAHVDFPNAAALPADWQDNPPDNKDLIVDCIVGIIDPLRGDVRQAVKTAQEAGVTVRMITGDNIATAKAIAKQCGILTEGGTAIEGPEFRKLTPAEADIQLRNLQVMGRSSPEDKHLMVTRLNGGVGLPDDQKAWEKLNVKDDSISWETHKDKIMPGYREEWSKAHPEGGQVVGVTGDGTNDAPALTAADVGLAMGITGTKVAQGAADIVILDDKFSSIVNAILWGRSVYDNIRKFLQFQVTVNIVALIVVFIGAAAGVGQPLTAVQMLWVNLIMDTLGALALGTEKPIPELLQRKPYKRESPLISWPMWRNIAVQGTYQLVLLFVLMFAGASMFGVRDMSSDPCFVYETTDDTGTYTANGITLSCSDWDTYCEGEGDDCYEESKTVNGATFAYSDWESTDFKDNCLSCTTTDYTHGTIIFNAFIWCQIFNEYTARNLFDDWNALRGITTNPMFLFVSVFSVLLQALIVEFGKDFTSTSPLTAGQWGWTILLGWFSMIFGVIQRFIPVEEDPNTFFTSEEPTGGEVAAEKKKGDYNQVAVAEVEMSENKA